jgi:hypothetical protein
MSEHDGISSLKNANRESTGAPSLPLIVRIAIGYAVAVALGMGWLAS